MCEKVIEYDFALVRDSLALSHQLTLLYLSAFPFMNKYLNWSTQPRERRTKVDLRDAANIFSPKNYSQMYDES